MKPTHFSRYLKFALFLAILCSFTTAYAYDFKVDGIYYNQTSINTVEVTYKDTNYNSYSGEVIIPSTVFYSNRTYTVTTIGDSAFYDCNGVKAVTIPESMTSIGEGAFFGCWADITCLSITPPSVNNSFEFSFSVFDYVNSVYDGGGSLPVIWVPQEALDNYVNSQWGQYSIICYIGAGETEAPSITMDFDGDSAAARAAIATITGVGTIYSRHEICTHYNSTYWSQPFWVEKDSYYYTPSSLNMSYLVVYAFAYEYGKLPSQVVTEESIYVYSYDYIPDPDTDIIELYDAAIDGISYNFGSEAVVVPDLCLYRYWDDWKRDWSYRCDRSIYNENDLIIIPSTVNYNGITYTVTTIGDYTFGSTTTMIEQYNSFIYPCSLSKVVIPSTVTSIGHQAFNNCSVAYLSIPNSVISMDLSSDYSSNWEGYEDDPNWFFINRIHLTGEGEWPGASIGIRVIQLDISSGLTTLSGLKVNPREVYCYAKVPPTCDENTFTDYTGTLHVPESSLAAYFTAPYWCNFANIVGDAVELSDLTLNKDSVELLVDEQLTLNATIQPANASIDSIIWESSNPSVATVSNDGVVTARRKGECDITVTVLDKRATCHVTVSEILPTSITLSLESALMERDSTLTLTATILPENATYTTVTWSSSNSSIATVNSQGIVTAHGVGECDITATCKNLTASCHVKVLERFIYITLDQHRASLLPNHILTLTPTVTPVATDLVVTSSNPSVAAARLANGKVQVVGVSVGTAIIKVASADGNAVADSCFVNVYTEAGDVDGDGFVKIDDVTALIDHLLGSNSSIDVGNADINYDGVVSIADVTGLIDYLLGGGASMSTRETFTVNGVNFTMIRVPAGTFMMGATEEQGSDANSWEKPVHEVTLTSSYLIGETEVTQELWLAVMGTNPSKHEGSLQKPVENVSWLDCQEFISQLNALTGLTFRMPTEAEWEYAARGANRSRGYKYAGSNDIADVGNVSSSTTMPVGSLQPNELNLYDMSGNVDEWVWDLFGYYTSEPQIDPTGPADGSSDHMYRGGSWYSGANTARVSYRFFRASTFKRGTMGLRLAL